MKQIASIEGYWIEKDCDGNGVRDYWTADVAGFYGELDKDGEPLKLIDKREAASDAAPAAEYAGLATRQVDRGYLFAAILRDERGLSYRTDANGDGKATTNPVRFGFCLYPAVYGATVFSHPPDDGREDVTTFTYFVNEKGMPHRMDTGGKPLTDWPTGHDHCDDGTG